jgi:hypothetical protein
MLFARHRTWLLIACFVFPCTLGFTENMPGFKPPPSRPVSDALVIVEDQQFLDECPTDKICIEGNLYNSGVKPAQHLKLRVDVGGGKYAKPRTSFFTPLDHNALDAGERLGFSTTIDRKLPYKNNKGEDKTIEAGKYNIKLVPVWSDDIALTNKSRTKRKH